MAMEESKNVEVQQLFEVFSQQSWEIRITVSQPAFRPIHELA